MPPSSLSDIQLTLDKLRIPTEFLKDEALNEEDAIRLAQWKTDTVTVLSGLKALLGDTKVADVEVAAAIVFAVGPCNGGGNWVVEEARIFSRGMYSNKS